MRKPLIAAALAGVVLAVPTAAVAYIMENSRNVGHAIDVTFIVRSLKRIGDHSKNIAEYVIFLVKGKDVRHVSPDSLDEDALEQA